MSVASLTAEQRAMLAAAAATLRSRAARVRARRHALLERGMSLADAIRATLGIVPAGNDHWPPPLPFTKQLRVLFLIRRTSFSRSSRQVSLYACQMCDPANSISSIANSYFAEHKNSSRVATAQFRDNVQHGVF